LGVKVVLTAARLKNFPLTFGSGPLQVGPPVIRYVAADLSLSLILPEVSVALTSPFLVFIIYCGIMVSVIRAASNKAE
jgi:hypothetical protein